MRLIDLYLVIKSERHALRYLSKICRKNGHRICAYCRGREINQIHDKRFRCKRCKAKLSGGKQDLISLQTVGTVG